MKENLAHGALCTPYRLIIIFRVFLNKSKLGLSYIKTKQGVVWSNTTLNPSYHYSVIHLTKMFNEVKWFNLPTRKMQNINQLTLSNQWITPWLLKCISYWGYNQLLLKKTGHEQLIVVSDDTLRSWYCRKLVMSRWHHLCHIST